MAGYDELIFKVGDLARDRLPGKPSCPRSMDRVYRAEEALVARRDELAALEQQLNEEDYAFQDLLAAHEEERPALQETVKRHKRVVDALDGPEVSAVSVQAVSLEDAYLELVGEDAGLP